VAENRVDLNVPLLALLTIAIKLGDSHIGMSLWQFAERESIGNISPEACRHAAIQSKVHSPESTLADDRIYQQRSIESLLKLFPDSPSLELEWYKINLGSAETALPSGLAEGSARLALAEKADHDDDPEEVLHQVDPILRGNLSNTNEARFHAAYAVALEFDALIALGEPERAAAAVVEHYVANSNLLRHIPFGQLIEGANAGKWSGLREQAYWPILVFLNEGDEQDIYEAMDDLLISHGCSSPLQVLEGSVPCPDSALRILLRDVLSVRVLARGALWGRTQEDRRKLRTEILRKLYSLSTEDQALVVDELSELTQARVLEEAYQNVEGPKFFLDFGDLNKRLATLLEDSYDRYLSFKSYEEKGGQLTDESELLEMVISGVPKPADDRKGETSEIILQNLATYVFGQYLFDPDRGVNATLRTRIIHGALENQLKRVLGAHSLLAAKGLDGNYKCDRAVDARIIECAAEDRAVIEAAYIGFTETIAEIYGSLVAFRLRIRLPESVISLLELPSFAVRDLVSEQGLIDFSGLFHEQVFARLREAQAGAFSTFVTELHSTFVAQAHETFRTVRQHIETELSQQVASALDALDSALVSALGDSPLRAALRADVVAARDEFAHDLGVIRKWFSAAAPEDVGIKSLSDIMATVGSVVDFASNNRLGTLVQGPCSEEIYEALDFEVGVALYEVLSILLRNVVQHSGLDGGQRVEYGFEVSGSGRRTLTLINQVADVQACASAVEEAERALSKPGDPRVLDRSPGGTGLGRIRALLAPHSAERVELQVRHGHSPAQFMIMVTY